MEQEIKKTAGKAADDKTPIEIGDAGEAVVTESKKTWKRKLPKSTRRLS